MTMHFQERTDIQSWGRVGKRVHRVAQPRFPVDVRRWNRLAESGLAVGSRRSYSDVCLCDGGQIVDMTGLDRFITFDPATGVLVAEAGVTIDALLKTLVPLGYFVAVTPGTRFVTLGGAVANDVHGKNHHWSGTFGRHVRGLVLERSTEGTLLVGPDAHHELFGATVGGLGLTGIITEVELQLQRIESSQLDVETVPCQNLAEVCHELEASDGFEHSVAWVDCTASGESVGRGIVTRANWARDGILDPHGPAKRSMPTDRVGALLNPLSLRAFNRLYHARSKLRQRRTRSHYNAFLYPLDSILHWNRLYGREGFYQFQCVVPDRAGQGAVRELLKQIAKSGEGSFLAVLKRFGDVPSPGLLSFPMPGLTLALDFRNRGQATVDLLARLDSVVLEAGGRHYPAKDMRLPVEAFRQGYPTLESFSRLIDPRCRSDFWKKVTA